MNSIGFELTVLAVLILANGLFAMSEIAVVSARKTRLQQQAEEGNRRAQVALELANAPNQFLATIQIGISLVGVLAGAFGGATVAGKLSDALNAVPILAPYSQAIAMGVVVLTITYLSLVIGELVPKRLGLNDAERVAATVAPGMRRLSRLASPIVRLLDASTSLVLRLLRVRSEAEEPVSEEEIKLMMRHGAQLGVFEPEEHEMVIQVFRLADQTINAVMTPRPEVVWLDLEDSIETIRQVVATSGYSRFPVARGDLDHVIGLVYVKDLLARAIAGAPLDLKGMARPALFLPESVTALEAVEHLRETRNDAALVIDEYGGFQGLLTTYDILEAIVGDLPAAGEAPDSEAVQREDGSWLLDGMLVVDELRDLLDLAELPYGGKAHYQTLGGLVMVALGRVPSPGDHFHCCGWRFEVLDMDGHRVDKVLASADDQTGGAT
jgi:putative hemolysin